MQGSGTFMSCLYQRYCMVFYSPGRTSLYPEVPPNKGIRYHFLGGGDEVGNVGCVFEDKFGNKSLLDYGLTPTDPPRYPNESPRVQNAVITHSHIDHIGMVPWLCGNYNSIIHATPLTAQISRLVWNDCYKVSRIEGYPLTWDKRDIDISLDNWVTHKYDKKWEMESWECSLRKAGHIPGAAMLSVKTDSHKLLFTGDFDSRDSPLTSGAKPEKCDALFIEGTYGGKYHIDKQENIKSFVENIVKVTDRGGTVLIPAFANGRTQDIVMTLHKYLPELDVHVDGMGKAIAKIQMDNPEELRDVEELKEAWKWCRRVSSKSDKKKALDSDCIVSTSGMMDGGPSIWYLNRLRHDTNNSIILTGYQAPGSGGDMLLNEGRVNIWGNKTRIPLDVEQLSFSTHAGHKEIVEFVEKCDPENVVIYHSDSKSARPMLHSELTSLGFNVNSPENGNSYNIN